MLPKVQQTVLLISGRAKELLETEQARAVRYCQRRLLQGPERALVSWRPMEGGLQKCLILGIRKGDSDDLDRQKMETFLYHLIISETTALLLLQNAFT